MALIGIIVAIVSRIRRKQNNKVESQNKEIVKETNPVELCFNSYTCDDVSFFQIIPEVHPVYDEEVSISEGFYNKFEQIDLGESLETFGYFPGRDSDDDYQSMFRMYVILI